MGIGVPRINEKAYFPLVVEADFGGPDPCHSTEMENDRCCDDVEHFKALGTFLSIKELVAELISLGGEAIPLLGPPEGISADYEEVGEFEGVAGHD